MIGYTVLGTNKLKEAAAFYDRLFAVLGTKRVMDFGTFIMWGHDMKRPMFALTPPYDKKEATVGNGVMVALAAPNRETVNKVYETAIENGGTCEGKPGPRGGEDLNFYAGYFRDLDGNKLNAFCMGTP